MKSSSGSIASTANCVAVELPADRRLIVRLGDDLKQPNEQYKLLLAFHFGSNTVKHDHPATVSLRLQPLKDDQQIESWWYKGDITFSRSGPVKIAECQDYTVAIVQKEAIATNDFRAQTRRAYIQLVNAVRATRHPNLVKVWNYFGDINTGNNDREKYRQFSIGRAEAFQDLGINDEQTPTGTAIGTKDDSGLSLIALASNHKFSPVENPRQVSAFNYPRKYGPSSPKFSRGGVVSSEGHKLFLISGTAAVVGHESNFPYNTRLQIKETFRNLDYLCNAISNLDTDEPQFKLDDQVVLRVYLKNPDDYELVSQKLELELKMSSANVTFVHGTICREELTVEIDGVKAT